MEFFARVTTALHHYFKPADDVLPSLMGDLSSSVSPATIKGYGQLLTLALNAKINTAKISSGGKTGKFPATQYEVYAVT